MSLSNSISLLAQRIASEFNNVRSALNLKAHVTHTHERSDINGLDSSLTSLSDQIGVVAGDLDQAQADFETNVSNSELAEKVRKNELKRRLNLDF